MSLGLSIFAIAFGYFIGAISFARLVVRVVDPDKAKWEKTTIEYPASEHAIETDLVSATSVRLRLGARYGCLTAILDIVKGFVPTLLVWMWFPEQPYYLLTSVATVVGHNWPVYYKFQGGRGLSPILGGFLAVDAIGLVITHVLGFVLTFLTASPMWAFLGGIMLTVPWFLIARRDPVLAVYALIINIIFFYATRGEFKQVKEIQDSGYKPTEEEYLARGETGSARMTRMMDNYTLPSLIKRLRTRNEQS
ncbi:MAG: glycerol-3-phosphate acyltransferase [Chloroflexota bacterium]